jgi:hypothetical protein
MRPQNRRSTRHALRITLGLGAICAASVMPPAALALASPLAESGGRVAYVDPGSGSFILQALVATAAGAAVAINAYWSKIKRVFGRGAPDEDDDATSSPPSDD